eukprot:scaffold167813_cov30-Tisochrysis_lutea.AAC.2
MPPTSPAQPVTDPLSLPHPVLQRDKLAVVDDSKTITAYQLPSTRDDQPKALFSEPHATSVAWNTDVRPESP